METSALSASFFPRIIPCESMSETEDIGREVKRRMRAVAADPSCVEEQIGMMLHRLRTHDIKLFREVMEEIKDALADDSRARLLAQARPRRRRSNGRSI